MIMDIHILLKNKFLLSIIILCVFSRTTSATLINNNAQLFVDRLNGAGDVGITGFDVNGNGIFENSDEVGVYIGQNGFIVDGSSWWRYLGKAMVVVGDALTGTLVGAAAGATAGAAVGAAATIPAGGTGAVPGAAIGAAGGAVVGAAGAGIKSVGQQIKDNNPKIKTVSSVSTHQPVQDVTLLAQATIHTQTGDFDLYAALMTAALADVGGTELIIGTGFSFTETTAFNSIVSGGDGLELIDTEFFSGILWDTSIDSGFLLLGISTLEGNSRGIDISDYVDLEITNYIPASVQAGDTVSVVSGFITTTSVPEPTSVWLLSLGFLTLFAVAKRRRLESIT
ncbi:MAG: hypothetical protein ACI8Z9_000905 [Paraglaciecola sp.]|jgi:hypothetical protein